jgi:glycosyltransferase involved in cell wall biosynthesis
MKYDNNLVSIIVRTNSSKRLYLLEKAIQSIIASDYQPIEIIIVIQSEDKNFIDRVEEIRNNYNQEGIDFKVIVNPTSKDERAKNLNLGIQAATGRYIGFLDDDDVIYPEHISSLVNILDESQETAWVYSDVAVVICRLQLECNLEVISIDYPFRKPEFSQAIFWQDNFIPIHSYLLDREKINPELLAFDESYQVLEDYAFLLKIAAIHEPIYLPKVTCEYRFFQDVTNSNFYADRNLGLPSERKKLNLWYQHYRKIDKIKKQLIPNYSSGLLPVYVRQLILARFPLIGKIKRLFPKLWELTAKFIKKAKFIQS